MAVSLVFSLVLLALGKAGFAIETEAEQFVQRIDFNEAVLHGMLGLFLFAGALQVKLDESLDLKWGLVPPGPRPYAIYRLLKSVDQYQVEILLTLSVALALSLPSGPARDAIVTITYMVVDFSILVQGLSLNAVLKWKQPV